MLSSPSLCATTRVKLICTTDSSQFTYRQESSLESTKLQVYDFAVCEIAASQLKLSALKYIVHTRSSTSYFFMKIVRLSASGSSRDFSQVESFYVASRDTDSSR